MSGTARFHAAAGFKEIIRHPFAAAIVLDPAKAWKNASG
jgi:hypothetical protein